MTLRTLDGVQTQQALVTGRVTDALSQQAVGSSVTVRLVFKKSSAVDLLAFPAQVRLIGGGYFAVGAPPVGLFTDLDPTDALDFRLTVEAVGYRSVQRDFTLSAADVTPTDQTSVLAGHTVTIPVLTALPVTRNVALSPHPVGLEGYVIRDDDPSDPVDGASVQVTSPAVAGPATTDAGGYFRIDALPVAAKVTVQITKDAASLTEDVEPRYTDPINQRTFSLPA